MQLRLAQLESHLKQPLRPLYLVAGEEPLLIQESLDALRAAARVQGASERQVLDADKAFDWSQLTQATASLSLFASKRLIEVNLMGSGPGDGAATIKEIAQSPPPDDVIVLIAGALEWKTRQAAWYSAIDQAGATLYIEALKPEQLPAWIAQRLKVAGLSASSDAIELLAHRTEGNLLAAQQDIEKLKLLHPGATLDQDQVRAAVADSARFDAFDLTDKVLLGDAAGAVRSLSRLREEGVELVALVGAWAWMLRQWGQAAAHYAQSRNATAACEAARIFGPRQQPYLKALPRVGPNRVYSLLARASSIDLKGKSTGGEPAAWEELLACVLAASSAAPSPQNRTP
ncbi:MAG TPA: DNA polymerase III subunit delta [Verrucomicrobiae bacterium]|nr:DNA polymerase III subunit delta [Verrucomicrobiae bacterium]